jgi:hypothetical protein
MGTVEEGAVEGAFVLWLKAGPFYGRIVRVVPDGSPREIARSSRTYQRPAVRDENMEIVLEKEIGS